MSVKFIIKIAFMIVNKQIFLAIPAKNQLMNIIKRECLTFELKDPLKYVFVHSTFHVIQKQFNIKFIQIFVICVQDFLLGISKLQ